MERLCFTPICRRAIGGAVIARALQTPIAEQLTILDNETDDVVVSDGRAPDTAPRPVKTLDWNRHRPAATRAAASR